MTVEAQLSRIQDDISAMRIRMDKHQDDDRADFAAMRGEMADTVEAIGLKIDRWGDELRKLNLERERERGRAEGLVEGRAPGPVKLAIIQGAAGPVAALILTALVTGLGVNWAKDQWDGHHRRTVVSTTVTSTAPTPAAQPLPTR